MSEDTPQIPQDAPAPAGATRVDAPPPSSSGGGPNIPGVSPEMAQEKPEILVAGAFAGAFVFAKLLRRIGGA